MDQVEVEVRLPGQIEPDALAVPFPEGASAQLSNGARELDSRLGGRLQRLAAEGDLSGELGRTAVVHTAGELNAARLVVAGIGKLDELDADALRTAAAAVARAVSDFGGTVAWLLDETLPLPYDE